VKTLGPVLLVAGLMAALLVASSSVAAQQNSSAAMVGAVPRLVNYSGVLGDASGKPITGVSGVTFLLYRDAQGGAPLWMETQNVTPDKMGRYTVQLGTTRSEGLPSEMFLTGEARWLAVQVAGGPEQARVLLVAVPYAMKAADAETVGGLPPSAFVLAVPTNSGGASANSTNAATSASGLPPSASNVTTTGGTVNAIPLFTTATNIQNSAIAQTGTGTTAKIGIGTTAPASTLDVKGTETVRGALTLPATAVATAAAGKNSQPQDFVASSFDSTSSTALNQVFQWRAEPAANNTANPSGTLNLLYGLGATLPSETGLALSNKGIFTFAAGQTFPGTGTGTITGVTTAPGSGLAGGGTTGTLNLSVPAAGITNAMLANPSLTLTAGGGMAGGGTVALGGATTLGLKTCSANQVLEFIASAWACANPAAGTVTSVGLAAPASDFTVSGSPVTGTGSLNLAWAVAPSSTNVPNAIMKRDGSGNVSAGTITAVGANLSGSLAINSSASFPFSSTFSNIGGTAILGNATATTGQVRGVEGFTSSNSGTAAGLFGLASATTGGPSGVYGQASSVNGVGVFGQDGKPSTTSSLYAGVGAGVWGDNGGFYYGVLGTSDDAPAGVFANNSPSGYAALEAESASSFPFIAQNSTTGASCTIDGAGNLNCTGTKNAIVPIDGGRRIVAMSAVESPQNWFEDFGSARLSGGSAVVSMDRDYIQTVNTELEYHVFLTPRGDCKGLYISQETPGSFEVKELGGGASNVSFSYRIVALRKKYESVRFADHTKDPDPRKIIRPMRNAELAVEPATIPLAVP